MITLKDIKPYITNAKEHPEWQIEKIAASIEAFGCNQPIVIDENNVIIAGHGRFEAMTTVLGYTELKEVSRSKKGDTFIPYVVIDDLSEDEIKAYRLADNQLNASTRSNIDLILAELHSLPEGLVPLTGYDPSQINTDKVNELQAWNEADLPKFDVQEKDFYITIQFRTEEERRIWAEENDIKADLIRNNQWTVKK